MTPAEIVRAHIPSLAQAAEEIVIARVATLGAELALSTGDETDLADLAVRECRCGLLVDGFYAYVEHLIDALEARS